jgi:CRISPR type I-E-associated protein CasB/Cse2
VTSLAKGMRELLARTPKARGVIEPRFRNLLNTSEEHLPEKLAKVASVARAHGAVFDEASLADALSDWPETRRRWAAEFWAGEASR